MTNYDVKRLALVLALQAEIEGMRISNDTTSKYDGEYYGEDAFIKKAEELREVAYKHDEQL